MKIFRFDESGRTPALTVGTTDVPKPDAGELLIRVQAAGVKPTELLWYPNTHTKDGGKRSGAHSRA